MQGLAHFSPHLSRYISLLRNFFTVALPALLVVLYRYLALCVRWNDLRILCRDKINESIITNGMYKKNHH